MHTNKIVIGAVVVTTAFVIGFSQSRSDSKFDRLAVRVDSLAISLTNVVAAVDRANPAPKPDTIDIGATGFARGSVDAPITMVEFLDYECPFCQRFHSETMPVLLKEYVETGKLRIVMRDNPLPFHENAMPAARTARCAGEHGIDAYWQVVDAMASGGTPLDEALVPELASQFGFDAAELAECASSDRYDAEIQLDVAAAAEAGLSGTPMFIVGPSRPDGQFRGRVIRGAYPIETFRAAIDDALAAASTS